MFRTAFSRCPLDGDPLDVCHTDPLAGCEFADRYIIEECIGEGAMGRVYRAKHRRVSRRFAIKVLFGDHAADAKMRSRFAREAEAASRLNHTNVISVIDFGETDEQLLYLVMDFVDGPSLTDVIEESAPLQRDRIVKIVRQLCKGLAHAHGRGLIHRDFKGENVILARDSDGGDVPKIVDFGIAMMLEARKSHKLTTEGMVLGTPAVMSPEQATGDQVDLRTDLFALGVVLYEMLCGVLPFEGTPMQIARQNLMDPVPRIAARVPGLIVDPAIEDLAHWLMAKKATDRPADAKAILEYLDELEGAVPSRASMLTPLPIPSELTPVPTLQADNSETRDAPVPVAREHSQPAMQSPDALGAAPTVQHPTMRGGGQSRRFLIVGAITVAILAGISVAAMMSSDPSATTADNASDPPSAPSPTKASPAVTAAQATNPEADDPATEPVDNAADPDDPAADPDDPAADPDDPAADPDDPVGDPIVAPLENIPSGATDSNQAPDDGARQQAGSEVGGVSQTNSPTVDRSTPGTEKTSGRSTKKNKERGRNTTPPKRTSADPAAPEAPTRSEVKQLYASVAGAANRLPPSVRDRAELQDKALSLAPTSSRIGSPEARTRYKAQLLALRSKVRRAKKSASSK